MQWIYHSLKQSMASFDDLLTIMFVSSFRFCRHVIRPLEKPNGWPVPLEVNMHTTLEQSDFEWKQTMYRDKNCINIHRLKTYLICTYFPLIYTWKTLIIVSKWTRVKVIQTSRHIFNCPYYRNSIRISRAVSFSSFLL